jgi:hypothetical protein
MNPGRFTFGLLIRKSSKLCLPSQISFSPFEFSAQMQTTGVCIRGDLCKVNTSSGTFPDGLQRFR